MMKHRVIFLRDNYRLDRQTGKVIAGNPVGCVAIKVTKNSRLIEYQVSVRNPLDRFDRAIARQLALGRLSEAPMVSHIHPEAPLSMHEITRSVMLNIAVDTNAVKRARKAARHCLKQNYVR